MKLFGATDKGLVRESNQDMFEIAVLSDTLAFAVVCDGMGGENGGGVASELTTRTVCDMLRRDLSDDMSESGVRAIMESAVAAANAKVYDTAKGDPLLCGMGTTLIIAVFWHNRLYIASVGDSRAYILRQDGEEQLTKDHTVVQMLLDIGEISEKDAQSHPQRHYITRAIGVSPTVDADFLELELDEPCQILICSDGLYNYLAPGDLPRLVSESLARLNADAMVEFSNQCGGADNTTAVIAAYENITSFAERDLEHNG